MKSTTRIQNTVVAFLLATIVVGGSLLAASFAQAQTVRGTRAAVISAPAVAVQNRAQDRSLPSADAGTSSDLGTRISCGVFGILTGLGVLPASEACGATPPPPPPPQSGTLTVVKVVSGGTASASAFTLHATGGSATPSTFAGSSAGTQVTIAANASYSVSEDATANYTGSFSVDCTGTMPASGAKTCTVTNTFSPATTTGTLTVIKDVSGGSAIPENFTLHVNSAASTSAEAFPGSGSGTSVSVAAGADYMVWEDASSTYTPSFSTDCFGTMPSGGQRTCNVINTFIPAATSTPTSTPQTGSLKVMKIVGGGTATSSDFLIHVLNASSTEVAGSPQMGSATGTTYVLPLGSYPFFETGGPSGYSLAFGGDCSQGSLSLTSTTTPMNCMLTNTVVSAQ